MTQVVAPDPGPRGKGYNPQGQQRGKAVFVDFGRNKIYALTADGEGVSVFEGLEDLVESLRPTVIVVDILPGKLQTTAAELAKTGLAFVRLKNLEKLSEERKNNGVKKTDENDVRLLKTLYHRHPEIFQPLFTTPEELEVRALTELWVELSAMKKASRLARTTTKDPVAAETNKTLNLLVKKLSEGIHEKAAKLPLYRRAFEELGLRGPSLAYIVSHDGWAFKTLPRDRLILRYQMTGRRKYKGRTIRSRLLITLAMSAVPHKHPRYYGIYQRYLERFKAEGRKNMHWKAVLRVAERILKDLHSLAKRTPDI